jgi:hypothetical protein
MILDILSFEYSLCGISVDLCGQTQHTKISVRERSGDCTVSTTKKENLILLFTTGTKLRTVSLPMLQKNECP